MAALIETHTAADPEYVTSEVRDVAITAPAIELTQDGLARLRGASTVVSRWIGATQPVGYYGAAFAQFLAHGSSLMHDQLPRRVANAFPVSQVRTGLPAERTVTVGVESVVHAFAQLTAYRVEGFEDPLRLTTAISRSGVIEQISGLLPLSVLGPMCLSGKIFPPPLIEPDETSKVRLTKPFYDFLVNEKHVYLATWRRSRVARSQWLPESTPTSERLELVAQFHACLHH